jgi:hypothetical protein
MTDTVDLRLRLGAIATEIEHWRSEASRLRAAGQLPDAASDDALLLSVEEVSGAIYRGIVDFEELVAEVDRKSHAAAGQVADLGDALRLVLLEITELGTRLYSLRSAAPSKHGATPHELIEFATSSNGDKWLLSLAEGNNLAFVEHRANMPSGGAITRTSVDTFLAVRPAGPEHESLRALLTEVSIEKEAHGSRS